VTGPKIRLEFRAPAPSSLPAKQLTVAGCNGSESVFTFFDRIEIGRRRSQPARPGTLTVEDPTVSSRHCVITQEPDGRCFVRDLSRNGTRLDGRRLSPNLKTAMTDGQTLSIGKSLQLTLDFGSGDGGLVWPQEPISTTDTVGVGDLTMVSVLVGDIRDYTRLVRRADPNRLQTGIRRVFTRLEREIEAAGGTLKEYQGDAIFAFWEQCDDSNHAARACSTALRLRKLVSDLARDRSLWDLGGLPLEMDFAVATGMVNITGYGGDGALGLSMVGEPVALAFGIEKIADETTGSIIVCGATRDMAGNDFEFREVTPVDGGDPAAVSGLFSIVEAGPDAPSTG
jgi:class 3 adenylate cyclase